MVSLATPLVEVGVFGEKVHSAFTGLWSHSFTSIRAFNAFVLSHMLSVDLQIPIAGPKLHPQAFQEFESSRFQCPLLRPAHLSLGQVLLWLAVVSQTSALALMVSDSKGNILRSSWQELLALQLLD